MSVFAVSIVKTLNAESNDLVAESKGVGYYYEHYSAIYSSRTYLFNDSGPDDLDKFDEPSQTDDKSNDSSISPTENLNENENIGNPDDHENDDEGDDAIDNYDDEPEEDAGESSTNPEEESSDEENLDEESSSDESESSESFDEEPKEDVEASSTSPEEESKEDVEASSTSPEEENPDEESLEATSSEIESAEEESTSDFDLDETTDVATESNIEEITEVATESNIEGTTDLEGDTASPSEPVVFDLASKSEVEVKGMDKLFGNTEPHNHKLCGVASTSACTHTLVASHDESIDYTPVVLTDTDGDGNLNNEIIDFFANADGSYYLTHDLAMTTYTDVTINHDINLCLNGFNIRNAAISSDFKKLCFTNCSTTLSTVSTDKGYWYTSQILFGNVNLYAFGLKMSENEKSIEDDYNLQFVTQKLSRSQYYSNHIDLYGVRVADVNTEGFTDYCISQSYNDNIENCLFENIYINKFIETSGSSVCNITFKNVTVRNIKLRHSFFYCNDDYRRKHSIKFIGNNDIYNIDTEDSVMFLNAFIDWYRRSSDESLPLDLSFKSGTTNIHDYAIRSNIFIMLKGANANLNIAEDAIVNFDNIGMNVLTTNEGDSKRPHAALIYTGGDVENIKILGKLNITNTKFFNCNSEKYVNPNFENAVLGAIVKDSQNPIKLGTCSITISNAKSYSDGDMTVEVTDFGTYPRYYPHEFATVLSTGLDYPIFEILDGSKFDYLNNSFSIYTKSHESRLITNQWNDTYIAHFNDVTYNDVFHVDNFLDPRLELTKFHEEIRILPPHDHKICGVASDSNCAHEDIPSHTGSSLYKPLVAEDFANTVVQGGYYYLLENVANESTAPTKLELQNDLYLCLNGYTLENYEFISTNLDKHVYICNCSIDTKAYLKNNRGDGVDGRGSYLASNVSYNVFGVDLEDGSGTNLAANVNQIYFAHMDTATSGTKPDDILALFNIDFVGNYEETTASGSPIEIKTSNEKSQTVYIEKCSFEDFKVHYNYPSPVALEKTAMLQLEGYMSHRSVVNIKDAVFMDNELKHRLVYLDGIDLTFKGENIISNNTVADKIIYHAETSGTNSLVKFDSGDTLIMHNSYIEGATLDTKNLIQITNLNIAEDGGLHIAYNKLPRSTSDYQSILSLNNTDSTYTNGEANIYGELEIVDNKVINASLTSDGIGLAALNGNNKTINLGSSSVIVKGNKNYTDDGVTEFTDYTTYPNQYMYQVYSTIDDSATEEAVFTVLDGYLLDMSKVNFYVAFENVTGNVLAPYDASHIKNIDAAAFNKSIIVDYYNGDTARQFLDVYKNRTLTNVTLSLGSYHEHTICGNPEGSPCTHTYGERHTATHSYIAITDSDDFSAKVVNGGYYFLSGNVDYTSNQRFSLGAGINLYLCLNGHSLSGVGFGTSDANSRVVITNCKFTTSDMTFPVEAPGVENQYPMFRNIALEVYGAALEDTNVNSINLNSHHIYYGTYDNNRISLYKADIKVSNTLYLSSYPMFHIPSNEDAYLEDVNIGNMNWGTKNGYLFNLVGGNDNYFKNVTIASISRTSLDDTQQTKFFNVGNRNKIIFDGDNSISNCNIYGPAFNINNDDPGAELVVRSGSLDISGNIIDGTVPLINTGKTFTIEEGARLTIDNNKLYRHDNAYSLIEVNNNFNVLGDLYVTDNKLINCTTENANGDIILVKYNPTTMPIKVGNSIIYIDNNKSYSDVSATTEWTNFDQYPAHKINGIISLNSDEPTNCIFRVEDGKKLDAKNSLIRFGFDNTNCMGTAFLQWTDEYVQEFSSANYKNTFMPDIYSFGGRRLGMSALLSGARVYTDKHYHKVCGVAANEACQHTQVASHDNGITFEFLSPDITQSEFINLMASYSPKNYVLSSDITITDYSIGMGINADINLCLNGHVLKNIGFSSYGSNNRVITITNCLDQEATLDSNRQAFYDVNVNVYGVTKNYVSGQGTTATTSNLKIKANDFYRIRWLARNLQMYGVNITSADSGDNSKFIQVSFSSSISIENVYVSDFIAGSNNTKSFVSTTDGPEGRVAGLDMKLKDVEICNFDSKNTTLEDATPLYLNGWRDSTKLQTYGKVDIHDMNALHGNILRAKYLIVADGELNIHDCSSGHETLNLTGDSQTEFYITENTKLTISDNKVIRKSDGVTTVVKVEPTVWSRLYGDLSVTDNKIINCATTNNANRVFAFYDYDGSSSDEQKNIDFGNGKIIVKDNYSYKDDGYTKIIDFDEEGYDRHQVFDIGKGNKGDTRTSDMFVFTQRPDTKLDANSKFNFAIYNYEDDEFIYSGNVYNQWKAEYVSSFSELYYGDVFNLQMPASTSSLGGQLRLVESGGEKRIVNLFPIDHGHKECGVTGECLHTLDAIGKHTETIGYENLVDDNDQNITRIKSGGRYVLTEDFDLQTRRFISPTSDLYICLNGHSLKNARFGNTDAKIVICNCSTNQSTIQSGFEYDYTDPVTAEDHRTFRNVDAYVYGIKDDTQSTDDLPVYNLKINTLLLHTGTNTNKKAFSNVEFTWAPPEYDDQSAYDNDYIDIKNDMTAMDSYLAMENVYVNNAKVRKLISIGDDSEENSYGKKVYIKNTLFKTVDCHHSILSLNNNVDLNFYGVNRINNFDVYNVGNAAFSATRSNLSGNTNITVHDGELNFNNSGSGRIWSQNIISLYNTNFTINENAKLKISNCSMANQASNQYRAMSCLYIGDNANVYNNGDIEIIDNTVSNDLTSIKYPNRFFTGIYKSKTAGDFTLGNGTINVYNNTCADSMYNKYCYQVYDAGNNTDYKTSNNMPTTFKMTGTSFKASESKLIISYNYADETSELFGTGRGIMAENFDSSHVLGYTDDLYKSVFAMRAEQNAKVYEIVMDGNKVLIRFIPHDHLECGASHSSECNHNLISQHTNTINYVPLSQWLLSSISNATFDWYYYIDDDCGQIIDLGGKTFNLTNDTYICLNGRTLKNVRFTETYPDSYKLYITNCKNETATIDNGNLVFARTVEPNVIANNGSINFKGEMFADGITDAFTLYNVNFEGTRNDIAEPGTINMLIEMQPGYEVLGKVILSSVSVANYYKHFNAYYLYLMRFANIDVEIDKLKVFNNKMDPHGSYIDGRDVAFINYYMLSESNKTLSITNSDFYDNQTFSLLSIPNTAKATLENINITNNTFSKNIFEVASEPIISINGKVNITGNEIVRKADTQSIINTKYVTFDDNGALEITGNKFDCTNITTDPTGRVSAVYVPSGSTYKIGNSYMVIKDNESINDTTSGNLNHVFGIYSENNDGFIEQLSGTKIKYDKTYVDSVAINSADGKGIVYKNWDSDHVEDYKEYCYQGVFEADLTLHNLLGINRNPSTHLELGVALQYHKICGCDPLKECNHRGIASHSEILEYAAIDGSNFATSLASGGKFFLFEDIDDSTIGRITLGGDVYLCLNGHSMTFRSNSFALYTSEHGLYICNCSEEEANIHITQSNYPFETNDFSIMSSGGKINATMRRGFRGANDDASLTFEDMNFYNIEYKTDPGYEVSGNGYISDYRKNISSESNIVFSSVSFIGIKENNLGDGSIINVYYNKHIKMYDSKFVNVDTAHDLIHFDRDTTTSGESLLDNVEFIGNKARYIYSQHLDSGSDGAKYKLRNIRDYDNTYTRFLDIMQRNSSSAGHMSLSVDNVVSSNSNIDDFAYFNQRVRATLSNITITNSTMDRFMYSSTRPKINITGLNFYNNIVNKNFVDYGIATDTLFFGDNNIYDNIFGVNNTDLNSGVFNAVFETYTNGDSNLTIDGQFSFRNNSVVTGSIFNADADGLIDFVGDSIFEDDGTNYINNGFIRVTDKISGYGTSKNVRIKGNTVVRNLRTKVDTNSVDFIYGGRLDSFIIDGGSLNIENCDLTYTTNANGYLDYSTLFNLFGYRGYVWEAGVIFEIRNGELNVKNNKFAGNMSEDKSIGMIQFNGYKGLKFIGNSKFDFSENNFTFYGRDNLSTARTSVYLIENNDNAISLANTSIRIASNSAIDVGATSTMSEHVFGLYTRATGSNLDYMLKQTDGTKISATDSIIDSIIFDDSYETEMYYGYGCVIKNWTSETVEGYTSEIYKKVFIPDLTRYLFVEAYMDGNDVKFGLLPHVHKLCGTGEHDVCTHRGIDPHTATISYMPISLSGGVAFRGYHVLDHDMVNIPITVTGDLYLCLAGYKMVNCYFLPNSYDVEYHVYITDCVGGGSIEVAEDRTFYYNVSGGIISNNTIEVKTDKLFFYGDSYSLDYYEAEYYNVRFNQRKSGEITTNNYGLMKSSVPGHVVLSSISVAGYSIKTESPYRRSVLHLDKGDVEIIDSKFSNNNLDMLVNTSFANISFVDTTIADNNFGQETVYIPYDSSTTPPAATVTFDGNTLVQNNNHARGKSIIFAERWFSDPNKSTISIVGNTTFKQEKLGYHAFRIAGNMQIGGNVNISDFEFGDCSEDSSIFYFSLGKLSMDDAILNISNTTYDVDSTTFSYILRAVEFEMNNSLLSVTGNKVKHSQGGLLSVDGGYNLKGTSSIVIKDNNIHNKYNIDGGIVEVKDGKYINIENGYIYIKDNNTILEESDALVVSGIKSIATNGFIVQAPGTKLDGANTYIENIRICPSLDSIEGKVYENFNATNVSGYTDTMYKTHFTPYKFDDPYLTMRMEEGDLWVAYGGHEHTACGVATSSLCHHEGIAKHEEILNYKPCYDAATLEAGGRFFLAKNIDDPAGNQFTLSGDLYLCLNGYSLNRLRITNGNGYKVYITNCRGNDVTISKDYGDAPMFNDTYPNILSTSSITVKTKKFVNVTRDTVSTNSMTFYNVDFREDTITGAKGSFITANKTDIILSSSSIANFDIQSSDDKFIDLQSGNLTILNSYMDSVLGGYEKACIIVQNGNILINNSYLHSLQSSLAEFIWVETGNLSIVKSTLSDIFGGHGSFITVRSGEMLINESTIDKIECISNYNFIVLQDCDLTIINSKLINLDNEIAHNLIDILSGDVTIDNSYIYDIDSRNGCFLNLRSGSLSMNDTNVELVKCNKLINANSITYRGKISIENVEYKNETYGLMQTANNSLFLEDANVSIKNCNTTTSTKFLSFANEIRLVDSKLTIDSNTIKRNATSLQEFLETNNLNLTGDSSLYVENNKINCAGVTNATRSTIIYLNESETFKIASSAIVIRNNYPINDTTTDNSNHIYAIYSKNINGAIVQAAGTKFDALNSIISDIAFDNDEENGSGNVYIGWSAAQVKDIDKASASQIFIPNRFLRPNIETKVLAGNVYIGLEPMVHTLCGVEDTSVCYTHRGIATHSSLILYSMYERSVTGIKTKGKYYLDEDLQIDGEYTLTGDLSLCLNGHKITNVKFTAAAGTNYKLNITDCVGGGEIVGMNGDTTFENINVCIVSCKHTIKLTADKLFDVNTTGRNDLELYNVIIEPKTSPSSYLINMPYINDYDARLVLSSTSITKYNATNLDLIYTDMVDVELYDLSITNNTSVREILKINGGDNFKLIADNIDISNNTTNNTTTTRAILDFGVAATISNMKMDNNTAEAATKFINVTNNTYLTGDISIQNNANDEYSLIFVTNTGKLVFDGNAIIKDNSRYGKLVNAVIENEGELIFSGDTQFINTTSEKLEYGVVKSVSGKVIFEGNTTIDGFKFGRAWVHTWTDPSERFTTALIYSGNNDIVFNGGLTKIINNETAEASMLINAMNHNVVLNNDALVQVNNNTILKENSATHDSFITASKISLNDDSSLEMKDNKMDYMNFNKQTYPRATGAVIYIDETETLDIGNGHIVVDGSKALYNGAETDNYALYGILSKNTSGFINQIAGTKIDAVNSKMTGIGFDSNDATGTIYTDWDAAHVEGYTDDIYKQVFSADKSRSRTLSVEHRDDDVVIDYVASYSVIYDRGVARDINGVEHIITGNIPSSTATRNTITTIHKNDFRVKGFKFLGYKASYLDRLLQEGEQINLYNHLTTNDEAILTAMWEEINYSIIIEQGESESSRAEYNDLAYFKVATMPEAFVKQRYKFRNFEYSTTSVLHVATTAKPDRLVLQASESVVSLIELDEAVVTYLPTFDEITYTIRFDGNGATSGTMPIQRATLSVDTKVNKNEFEKEGSTFHGWALATDSGIWLSDEGELTYGIKVDEHIDGKVIKLYAVWNVNEYSVIFNKGDGDTGYEKVVKTKYGEVATVPNADGYSREKYKFGRFRWKETIIDGKATTAVLPKAGYEILSPNAEIKNLSSIKATYSYLAEYDDITYTISFDGNGSTSGSMSVQVATLSIDTYVDENRFAKTGYHFIGWATSSTATTSWITDMGELAYPTKVDETIDGKEIKLYAVWEANKYSLVFNRGEGQHGDDKIVDTEYDKIATVANAVGFKKERYKFDRYKWVNTIYHGEATTSIAPRSGFETLNPNQEITNLTEENDVIFNYEVEYDEVTYTIAFDGNGATSGTMSPQRATLSVVDTRLKPNSFSKDEIPFQGWALATDSELWLPNEGLLSYPDKVDESVDGTTITLYAIWNINDYWLTFDKGDGDTGEEQVVSTRYGRIATAPNADGYSKQRYKFGRYKWIETIYEGKATTSITPRAGFDTLSPNQTFSSLTIYEATLSYIAEYDDITYTISFDGNGATSGSMPAQIATLSIDTYVNENKFERTGYHFLGWATSSTTTDIWIDNMGAVTYPTMVDESIDGQVIDLYAVWEPNEYSLVFNKGTGTEGSDKRIDTKYGELATVPNADGFKKNRYKFGRYKWVNTIYHGEATTSIMPRAGYETLNPNQEVTNLTEENDVIFNYEVEYDEVTYTIAFDGNGATSGTMSPQRATLSVVDTKLKPNEFSQTGSAFQGWARDPNSEIWILNEGELTYPTKVDESVDGTTITLYAVWNINEYSLVFSKGSGTQGSDKRVDTRYGRLATAPNADGYFKPRYKFGRYKWVNTIYHGEATTSIAPRADLLTLNPNQGFSNLSTYEATFNYEVEYDEIHYNIHFNENGGVGHMADQSATLSETTYLHLNQFIRTGYKFVGWADSDTGSVVYADGGSIGSNLPESVEGQTVELYAKWEEIKYNVIFKNGSSVIQTNNNVSYTQNITSPQAPASDLYRFVEFRTADAASVSVINANTSVSMLTAIDGNTITYDTIFEEIVFNVEFNANGGTGSMTPIVATLSKPIDLPANAGAISRTDMRYEGWSKTSGEANPINFQDAATLPVGTFTKAQAESGNVTIYACWSYDNYTLVINPNGHGGSTARRVSLARSDEYLLVATFSEANYTLLRYNSNPNGNGTNYALNSNYRNDSPRTSEINIYAIWQYNGGGGGGPGGGGGGSGGGGGGGGVGGRLPGGAGMNGYVGLIIDKPGVYNTSPKGAWLFDPNIQYWLYGLNVRPEDAYENAFIPYQSVTNNGLECLANGIYRMSSGRYYYFDSNGLMRVGLIQFNGTMYYAETSGEFAGALCTGTKIIDGIIYEFDASGEYIQPTDGVKNIDAGIWVYDPIGDTWSFMLLTEAGALVAITNGMYGIKNSKNEYDNYYFNENGIMQVGIVYYNGKYHYMSEAATDRGRENVAITNALNQ